MKRILLVLALVSSVTFANAQQVKSEAAAQAALTKAKADADNAKKATKVATWLKLAQSYMDAYAAPAGNGWVGATAQELKLVMGNMKPTGTSTVDVNGQKMTKESYASADYYYNEGGQLVAVKVTKPIVADALAQALNAYTKAAAVDPKGSKTADIVKGIRSISEKYTQEAYDCYTFGDMAGASKAFEAAAAAAATAPCSEANNDALYNAGFTAWACEDYQRAKSLFQKCVDAKYYGEDGDVFAKLADATEKLGDKVGAKDILEQGFAAYPSSQAVLVGLINYYTASGEDKDRLFTLLDNAKKNEPTNASLYYVEGNIYKELGESDKAIASYRQAGQVNPNYEFGYIGEGMLLYNMAADIQEKAQSELDDTKYMALVADFEKALKGCVEPFEKAFEVTKDADTKAAVAEYLKNATFRFRDSDDAMKAKYEKYSAAAAE